MSRKKRVYKKNIISVYEPLFHTDHITKLTNRLMYSGKKSIAEKIVRECFYYIKRDLGKDPIEVFTNALKNITPVVNVISIRIAGSNYQVPVEVQTHRQIMYALKWLIDAARKRTEKTMSLRLYKEILDAHKNTGAAVDQKQKIHKMAEANRAYAHYRW